MHRPSVILTLLILLIASWGLISQPVQAASTPLQQDEDLEQLALNFIDQLHNGSFTDATQNFTAKMHTALPPERLDSIWAEITKKYGPYQGVSETQIEAVDSYTAVNVHAQFEKALINLRVVIDQDKRIAGFFYNPLKPTGRISTGFLVSLAISALLVISYPFLLGFRIHKRYQASWRFFAYGAGIFVVFQLVMRIPLVQIIQALFGNQLRASNTLQIAWLVALSFSAGLFEEIGRYVGYRWIMPNEQRSWKIGVMYGLGHGGIEAILLVGLTQLVTLGLLAFSPILSTILPAEIQGLLVGQTAALVGSPPWLPFLAAWERLWTVLFHCAMSLVVLQVFRQRRTGWLWLAVALHTITNIVVVIIPTLFSLPELTSQLLSEVLVGLIGLIALWAILQFKTKMGAD